MMNITTGTVGATATIYIQGKFDLAMRQKFNAAMQEAMNHAAAKNIEVHLGAADYIDSSACGMLLLLKQKATSAGKTVLLSNAKGAVKQVLRVMNFEKMFQIT